MDRGAWWAIVHSITAVIVMQDFNPWGQGLGKDTCTGTGQFFAPCCEFFSQFSRSVVSDSLQPHESQHARPPVHHQFPEFTQTHVHRVGDAIQPSM